MFCVLTIHAAKHVLISTRLCVNEALVICAGRVPVECAQQQQFLHENAAQLCSYLVCRFVLGQGQGARKEVDKNGLFVIWLCSKFALAWDRNFV